MKKINLGLCALLIAGVGLLASCKADVTDVRLVDAVQTYTNYFVSVTGDTSVSTVVTNYPYSYSDDITTNTSGYTMSGISGMGYITWTENNNTTTNATEYTIRCTGRGKYETEDSITISDYGYNGTIKINEIDGSYWIVSNDGTKKDLSEYVTNLEDDEEVTIAFSYTTTSYNYAYRENSLGNTYYGVTEKTETTYTYNLTFVNP